MFIHTAFIKSLL